MRKFILIIVLILSFFIIFNLSQSITRLWQKQDLLINAKKELGKEKQINEQLKRQEKEVNSRFFIEEQARDKLLYVKPDEQLVILPNNLIVHEDETKKKPIIEKPNWEQWRELFFN